MHRISDKEKEVGDDLLLRNAAQLEMEHIRALGKDPELILATANLAGYEAVLHLISSGGPMPVYELVSGVQSRYASHSGIISRIKAMRDRGLLEASCGVKRSQVCLQPSEALLSLLRPVLLHRSEAQSSDNKFR